MPSAVKVEYAGRRLVGNQYVGVVRYVLNGMPVVPVDGIFHEQRYAVKPLAVYPNTGIAEVMAITAKSKRFSPIKTVVMIAGDEDFMVIGQGAEPADEVGCLIFRPGHGEVA